MTDLPRSSKYLSRPQAPVTDADREQLSHWLNRAYTNGDLQNDVFTARLDQLFAAEHLGELVPVVEGLPPEQTFDQPAIIEETASAARRPGELGEARNAKPVTLAVVAVVGVAAAVVLLALLLMILF